MQSQNRHAYLDGLRGLAALAVVFCHFRLMFYEDLENQSLQWLQAHMAQAFIGQILWAFLNMLSNGPLAVFIFWFMSGYVISIRFFAVNPTAYVTSAFVKRYLRLALPATASVLIACALMYAGALISQDFFVPAQSNAWLHLFYGFDANWLKALKNGLWDTFFNYREAISYNASLWTMNMELYGSFLCFFLFALFRTHAYRYVVYAGVLAVLFFQQNYALITFMAGFVLCDMDFANGRKHALLLWLEQYVFSKGYLALLLFLAACYFAGSKTHVDIRDMLSSSALVFIISRTAFLKKVLALPWLTKLGQWSFGIYLMHLPILCSLTCYLYTQHAATHKQGVLWATALSLPFIIAAGALFTVLVDKPAIRLSNRLGQLFNQNQHP